MWVGARVWVRVWVRVRVTLANAVAVRQCTRPPMAGSLRTAVLPMSSEGMSMAYLARG